MTFLRSDVLPLLLNYYSQVLVNLWVRLHQPFLVFFFVFFFAMSFLLNNDFPKTSDQKQLYQFFPILSNLNNYFFSCQVVIQSFILHFYSIFCPCHY